MTIRILKILFIVYSFLVGLFLFDSLTSFEIKNQALKLLIYFGTLLGTPLIIAWSLLIIKTKTRKIITALYPTIILIFILLVGPTTILQSTGVWRTQTILYQHKDLDNKKVEFQMQDIGARGYLRRTVEVLYLTPLFTITSESPWDIDKRVEWIKIDKDVNELGLKSP